MAVGILLLILLCLLGCFIYYWRKNNEEEEYDYKPNNVAEDRCSCAVAALRDDGHNNYVCRFYGRNRNSFNYSHFNSYVSRPGSSDSLGQDSRLESTPVTVSSRAARRWHPDTRHSSCR